MPQDLKTLLKKLQELNRLAAVPGKISREELEDQAKQITLAVREALAEFGKSLPPELAGATGLLVDVLKIQIGTLVQQSGLSLNSTEEMKKLANEMELMKRTYIRS